MIRAVVFDLGGTLHLCTNDDARKLWFARRLIGRLGEYGASSTTMSACATCAGRTCWSACGRCAQTAFGWG